MLKEYMSQQNAAEDRREKRRMSTENREYDKSTRRKQRRVRRGKIPIDLRQPPAEPPLDGPRASRSAFKYENDVHRDAVFHDLVILDLRLLADDLHARDSAQRLGGPLEALGDGVLPLFVEDDITSVTLATAIKAPPFIKEIASNTQLYHFFGLFTDENF